MALRLHARLDFRGHHGICIKYGEGVGGVNILSNSGWRHRTELAVLRNCPDPPQRYQAINSLHCRFPLGLGEREFCVLPHEGGGPMTLQSAKYSMYLHV